MGGTGRYEWLNVPHLMLKPHSETSPPPPPTPGGITKKRPTTILSFHLAVCFHCAYFVLLLYTLSFNVGISPWKFCSFSLRQIYCNRVELPFWYAVFYAITYSVCVCACVHVWMCVYFLSKGAYVCFRLHFSMLFTCCVIACISVCVCVCVCVQTCWCVWVCGWGGGGSLIPFTLIPHTFNQLFCRDQVYNKCSFYH